MKEYRVTWELDVLAESPKEAAKKALEVQRDPNSWATVFDVASEDGADVERIDVVEEHDD